jgi:hypothetical protein
LKRFSLVRTLSKILNDDDLAIFIGNDLCKEAFAYDRPGNLYLPARDNMLSFALGVILGTNKRVYIFCDDFYYLRNASEAAHLAVSRCTNAYLFMFVSGYYMDIGKFPSIYESIVSPQNMLFNMGFLVHNYTKHFKNIKNASVEVKAILEKTKGPFVGVIDVDFGLKKTDVVLPEWSESIKRATEFMRVEEE